MTYFRTISSYDSYQMNIRNMYNNNTPYYMANTDHGHGGALPIFARPESIPKKVKKKLVKPGDRVAEISGQSQVKLSNTQKIYGKLLNISYDNDD